MKKLIVACAVVLGAGLFASCGDTNYCYEITTTYKILGEEISTTTKSWCTSNDIKTAEANAKQTLIDMGISEDVISVSSKRTGLSQAECK
jgi:hypothetical protein